MPTLLARTHPGSVVTDPDDPAKARVESVWDDLLADLAATAEEYRDEGWETLELHPGDVTALSGQYGDRVGFDLLIPDDEYRDVEVWFDAGLTVDGYEVYRSTVDGVVFLLVAVRDEDARRAVLFPAYYSLDDDRALAMFESTVRAGTLHTYLRRLSGDYVELEHEDPELLAPPEDTVGSGSGETPDLDGPTGNGGTGGDGEDDGE